MYAHIIQQYVHIYIPTYVSTYNTYIGTRMCEYMYVYYNTVSSTPDEEDS